MSYNLPRQKLRQGAKTKAWGKEHLALVSSIAGSDNHPFRTTMKHKDRNIRSYNGDIGIKDYEIVLNPNGMSKQFMPKEIQHIPIATPYLNVLIGEEFERKSDFKAIALNPTTISSIQEKKNDMLKAKIYELLQDPALKEEDAKGKLREYMRYLKYSYQDSRERRVNLLLKKHIKDLDLNLKFNENFKYVTLVSEESYYGDVVNGKPIIEVINPKNIFVLSSGDSTRYEDADLIIISRFKSPNQLLDKYSEYLKPSEVTKLEDYSHSSSDGKYKTDSQQGLAEDAFIINTSKEAMDGFLHLKDMGSGYRTVTQGDTVDGNGNIRELIVLWASKKLVYKVKRYDPDTGEEVYEYRDETYIADTDAGEEVKELWITQWYEGVQLGEDIYPFIRPRRLQFNDINNPFYNHPGIVGEVYNTGGLRAKSLMDRAFPYQLIYDVNWRKLTTALSKFMGSLIEVDYATLPKGWDVTKWMYFADKAGIAVKDSFKEGNKGASVGKLAGGLGNSGKVINQDLGHYIQQTINLLEFIETRMGRILGVPPQRLGEVSNRETVGGVERAVTQSSFITNELYKRHDNVKKRVLTLLMELCKVAYKDNPQAFQYIGDDAQSIMFDIDNELLEDVYGIVIDNDNDVVELEQKLDGLLQAAIQGRTIKFSDAIKFYASNSISEKMRIIEYSEDEALQQEEDNMRQQQELEQSRNETLQQIAEQQEQRLDERESRKLELDKYRVDEQEFTKRMGLGMKMDLDSQSLLNASEDNALYDKEQELLLKMRELDETIRNNKAKEALELKKINKETKKVVNK